jgi:hypothetical protein
VTVSLATLWLVLTATATGIEGPPRVHVRGVPELSAAIGDAVRREQPDVALVQSATAANLVAELRVRGDRIELSFDDGEARALGSTEATEAALRRGVLLIVHRLEALRRLAPAKPGPLAPTTPEPSSPPPDGPRTGPISTAVAPSTVGRAELGTSIGLWTTPRIGLSLALHGELGALELGARLVARGLCCTVHGDNIDAEGWALAALAEARWSFTLSPVRLGLGLGLGASYMAMSATAVELFVGDAGAEPVSAVSALLRPSAHAGLALTDRLALVLVVGAEVHSSTWTVRVPNAFLEGRAPLERGIAQPFGELGLAWQIW